MEDTEIKVRQEQQIDELKSDIKWYRDKMLLMDTMLSKVLQAYIENTNENERKRQDFSVNVKKENNET